MASSTPSDLSNRLDLGQPEEQASRARQPRCVGLIGGMGPPSTVHYYKALLDAHAARGVSARLLITHADMSHALGFVTAGDRAGLARYPASLLHPLARAGAALAAVSAVTPHLCIPELRELSPLPLVDIIDALVHRLRERGVSRMALLGTRFTMNSRLFGRLDGFDVTGLAPSEVDEVHRIYLSVASDGEASPADTAWLRALCHKLHEDNGAEAIVLAGTELSLVLHEGVEAFPLLDCAKAHVEIITEQAVTRAEVVAGDTTVGNGPGNAAS